jgi:hypothetical protein
MSSSPASLLLAACATGSKSNDAFEVPLSQLKDLEELFTTAESPNVEKFLESLNTKVWREQYSNIEGEYAYIVMRENGSNSTGKHRFFVRNFYEYVKDSFLEGFKNYISFDTLCQYIEEHEEETLNEIDNQIHESVFEIDYVPSIRELNQFSEETIKHVIEYINEDSEVKIPVQEFISNIDEIRAEDIEYMGQFSWYDYFSVHNEHRFMSELYRTEISDSIFKHKRLEDRLNEWNTDNRDWDGTAYLLEHIKASEDDLADYSISKSSLSELQTTFEFYGPIHANGLFIH